MSEANINLWLKGQSIEVRRRVNEILQDNAGAQKVARKAKADAEVAERQVRDMAVEMQRLRTRIAELESVK